MNTTSVSRLGGHALIEALVAQGVARVYGVPGESYLHRLFTKKNGLRFKNADLGCLGPKS